MKAKKYIIITLITMMVLIAGNVWASRGVVHPFPSEITNNKTVYYGPTDRTDLLSNSNQAAADWLLAQQDAAGWFPWGSGGAATTNTQGPSGRGLLKAYEITNDITCLNAAISNGNYIVNTMLLPNTGLSIYPNGDPHFSMGDPLFLEELSLATGDATYADFVQTYFWDKLTAGQYGESSDLDAAGLGDAVVDGRTAQGIVELSPWDLSGTAIAADVAGQTIIRDALMSKILRGLNETTSAGGYDAIGLAGAVWASAVTDVTLNPTAGIHIASNSTADLAVTLASWTLTSNDGAWLWSSTADPADNTNGDVQTTSFAIMALNALDRSTYIGQIARGVTFIKSLQENTGEYLAYLGASPGDAGSVEVQAEAISGIVTVTPSDVYIDATWTALSLGDDPTGASIAFGYDAFDNIQDGIGAVVGSTVNVAAGIYTEQLHITKANLTILGTSTEDVIVKSPANLTHFYNSGSNDNYPIIFVDGGDNCTLKKMTVDGDNQGNANYRFQGIGYWNAGGTMQDIDVINVMDVTLSGAQHGVGVYAFNNIPAESYSIVMNNVDIYNFQKNAIALWGESTTNNLNVNLQYVTTTGVGPTEVTAQNGIQVSYVTGLISNCDVSDIDYTGSSWAASGILAQYTTDFEISDNEISDCNVSIYAYENTNMVAEDNIISGASSTAILDYFGVDSQIKGNEISDSNYGIRASTTEGVEMTDNEIDGTGYAIILNGIDHTVTGNLFSENYAHIYNFGTEPDVNTLTPLNTFDNYFVVDQIVYGNATLLYVDVPDEVIPPNFTQNYSVKASYIEALRGYAVKVKIPKADFDTAPTNFAIGPLFSPPEYAVNEFSAVDSTNGDTNDWIYKVTGSYLGAFTGITDEDVVLFTFDATSTADYSNVIAGCDIVIDYDSIILKDDQNPVNEIACSGTVDGWVVIDNEDALVVIDNIDDYDDPNPYIIQHDGSGMIIPEFDLTYTDDYDLATAMYQIRLEISSAPNPVDFTETVGAVDGTLTDIDNWPLPIDELVDGEYTLYLLVTDEAGNDYILDWDFKIDTNVPTALEWELCHTTPNQDISVDLGWSYEAMTAPDYIDVWALDYAAITSITTNPYPEYDPTDLIVDGTIINDIDPYTEGPSTLGWIKVAEISVGTALTLDNSEWVEMTRGYYYFTIYGVAENGQISDAPADPFYRESISYWPGDVDADGDVLTSGDISVLSGVWGSTSSSSATWDIDRFCDVGPTVDNGRRSLPTPDDVIDIEDLMIFAMNYDNTDYEFYPRGIDLPEVQPILIEMICYEQEDGMSMDLILSDNNAFLKGINIPVQYDNGLILQSVELGDIWPECSMLFHTDQNNIVEISASTLGAESLIEGNGNVVTLNFEMIDNFDEPELLHMTARTINNQEIEIINNPTGPTGSDPEVPIPENNELMSNFPNPFNPTTTISYGLKEDTRVTITLYNIQGQKVKTLVNEIMSAGNHQVFWNGRDENNKKVASGIYFYSMKTKDYTNVRKAMLLK